MEVFFYQVAILFTVVLATILFGQPGMWIAVAAAVIWTLVRVFTNWLVILQLVTVLIALGVAETIKSSKNFKDIQGTGWVLLIVSVGALIWFINKNESTPPQSEIPVARSTSTTLPAMPNASHSTGPGKTSKLNPSSLPSLMDRTIADLESTFPQLNQNSNQFNQRLVDMTLEGQRKYIQIGMSPENALARSAREVMEEYSNPKPVPLISSPVKGQTIVKECINRNGSVAPTINGGCRPNQRTFYRNE